MSIEIEVGFRRAFPLGDLVEGVREVLGLLGPRSVRDAAVVLAKPPREDTDWAIEPLLAMELANPVVPEVTSLAVVCGSPAEWVCASLDRRLGDQPPWPPDRLADESDDEYWMSQPGSWDVTPNRCRESAFLALVVAVALARLSDGWIANRASQVTVAPALDGVWESHDAVLTALRPPAGESDPIGYVLARSGYAEYEKRPCPPA